MIKKSIFMAVLVLCSCLAFAQDMDNTQESGIILELNGLYESYQGQEMPKPFAMIFGNENINIYIDDIKVGVKTQEGRLKIFQTTHFVDPTMNVYTTEDTIKSIMSSQDPGKAAQEALNDGDITYKGVGVGKKVKLFFVKIGATVAGWFM